MQEIKAGRSPRVSIQGADFELAQEVARLRDGDARVGAVCAFVGTVRDRHAGAAAGSVSAVELEHYPGMTEQAIEAMIDEAHRRFDIIAAGLYIRPDRCKQVAFAEPIFAVGDAIGVKFVNR